MTLEVRKTLLCMFGAIGGGALSFKRVRVAVAGMQGEWECLGSMDVDAGETFQLSATPVWVRPYIAALQLAGQDRPAATGR